MNLYALCSDGVILKTDGNQLCIYPTFDDAGDDIQSLEFKGKIEIIPIAVLDSPVNAVAYL